MRKGFSLVELSVVLAIIGLIAGGVMAGRSLIHSAKLQETISDMEKYKTAAKIFEEQYHELPGDMSDATSFWGSAGGNSQNSTCLDAQTLDSKATCNGDGNSYVRHGHVTGSNSERFLFWKHIANAGLVEGLYPGVSSGGAGTYQLISGTTAPELPISKSSYVVMSLQEAGHASYFAESNLGRNLFMMLGISGTNYNSAVLAPKDAWKIDSKLDDGSPAYGNIFTTPSTSSLGGGCSTTASAATSEYDLTETDVVCIQFMVY